MPHDYEKTDAPSNPVRNYAYEQERMKAAHFAGQEKAQAIGGGGALGNYPSATATRMTADAVLQQKIESLYNEINGLKALRAALPREMGFEADAAFWKLIK